jgi:hypothetical protein
MPEPVEGHIPIDNPKDKDKPTFTKPDLEKTPENPEIWIEGKKGDPITISIRADKDDKKEPIKNKNKDKTAVAKDLKGLQWGSGVGEKPVKVNGQYVRPGKYAFKKIEQGQTDEIILDIRCNNTPPPPECEITFKADGLLWTFQTTHVTQDKILDRLLKLFPK